MSSAILLHPRPMPTPSRRMAGPALENRLGMAASSLRNCCAGGGFGVALPRLLILSRGGTAASTRWAWTPWPASEYINRDDPACPPSLATPAALKGCHVFASRLFGDRPGRSDGGTTLRPGAQLQPQRVADPFQPLLPVPRPGRQGAKS